MQSPSSLQRMPLKIFCQTLLSRLHPGRSWASESHWLHGGGDAAFEKAGIADSLDEACVRLDGSKSVAEFIGGCRKLRFWKRRKKPSPFRFVQSEVLATTKGPPLQLALASCRFFDAPPTIGSNEEPRLPFRSGWWRRETRVHVPHCPKNGLIHVTIEDDRMDVVFSACRLGGCPNAWLSLSPPGQYCAFLRSLHLAGSDGRQLFRHVGGVPVPGAEVFCGEVILQ